MKGPTKTVSEVLKGQREIRLAEVTIALQDFQELPPDQQTEFLLTNLLHQIRRVRDLEIKLDVVVQMLLSRDR